MAPTAAAAASAAAGSQSGVSLEVVGLCDRCGHVNDRLIDCWVPV